MPARDKNIPATQAALEAAKTELMASLVRHDQTLDRHTQTLDRQARAIVELQADVRQIKQTMSTKDDISRILDAIDSIVPKGEAYSQKAATHGAILQEHESTLRDHGKRITRLEAER
ncbi:MAG: hypothetical protein HY551_00475 [Elusimicrobia bacterium]|nr:hypothetical protein [Elusimicrobiota bacterium]